MMFQALDQIDYSQYSTEAMPCAMTGLQWVVWTALGAVVVVLAIGVWVAKRWIPAKSTRE